MGEPASETYDWLHFAARSGGAGASWAREYRRHGRAVALCDRALAELRQRRLDEGSETLRRYAEAIAEEARDVPASMRRVFDRWYHGVAAFERYAAGDFDRAGEEMDRAHEAVVEALSADPFLLMLAIHCQEFRLHHARIARNRLAWDDLETHARRAREMTADQVPLCHLRGGEPVFFSTVGGFVDSVPGATPAEREVARGLLDGERRMRLFDQFLRRLYTLPDFAIQYP